MLKETAGLDMPSIGPSVGDLRRACDRLLSLGDGSSVRVARAIGAILLGVDPIAALGLKAGAGRRSALTKDRIAARDDLIRRMAARHYAGLSTSAQAREISLAASAYNRRAARLDIDLDDMPASYAGMPREFLFHIGRLPAAVPSERTLRLVLASSPASLAASPPLFAAN